MFPSRTITAQMRGAIYSPQFPKNYGSNSNIVLTLRIPVNFMVTMWFDSFSMECKHDVFGYKNYCLVSITLGYNCRLNYNISHSCIIVLIAIQLIGSLKIPSGRKQINTAERTLMVTIRNNYSWLVITLSFIVKSSVPHNFDLLDNFVVVLEVKSDSTSITVLNLFVAKSFTSLVAHGAGAYLPFL